MNKRTAQVGKPLVNLKHSATWKVSSNENGETIYQKIVRPFGQIAKVKIRPVIWKAQPEVHHEAMSIANSMAI